ncbi:MAG: cupin domain-containing protein [Chloroflexi bacterium]|nr:cupin domain-containing protein [Chloroflexota bacterium]
MEPVIRNYRGNFQAGGPSARLIWLDDGPPTVTLTYLEIEDGKTSPHHIHPWEHEVFILEGSGTLLCDDVQYPVRAGDAVFIPGDVDHYTLNNGGQGLLKRIEVNPLMAAQSGGAQNEGGEGTGKPPTILNLADIDLSPGSARPILTAAEGAINYTMFYRGLEPGESSPTHAHAWEHQAYILKGTCTLVCDGVDFRVREGDAILVPPHAEHEWRSDNGETAGWLVFNPIAR